MIQFLFKLKNILWLDVLGFAWIKPEPSVKKLKTWEAEKLTHETGDFAGK